MKFVVTTMFLLYAQSAFAIFSAFEIINPSTQIKHNISVEITEKKENKLYYDIKITKVGGHKHAWLIESTKQLQPDDLEFREYIWSGKDDNNHVKSIRKIEVLEGELVPDKKQPKLYLKVSIPKEKIDRSYIYLDFPSIVFDGGYYYAIDLSSYVRNIKK